MPASDNRVHHDLAEIALDRVEGFAFERFANDFLSSVEGRNFVPLGGVGDGGADGFESRELFETETQNVFYQLTTQSNHRDKIRKTVRRLIEFGRTPKSLRYVTSIQIPHIDKEEDLLSEELSISISIRDKRYLTSHINDSSGTIAAYWNHLSRYTAFLEKVGTSSLQAQTTHAKDPTVYVFLQHEVANRLGNRKLVHSITDTLILWALRDTNPENNILLSRDELLGSICDAFPWANNFIKSHIDDRLEKLRSKSVGGREIRWHRKADKYCLPFETRESIKSENTNDESLKIEFINELSLRASGYFSGDDGDYKLTSELALSAIEKIFERQGLVLAHFLANENESDAPLVISDCIEALLDDKRIPAGQKSNYRDYIERLVCSVFYDSSPTQRQYLSLLSRTYVLLFTLQAEPRVIEYFSSMGTSFKLFVGSDILVRALSERYLEPGDQPCRNLLKVAASSGMKLNLSSSVLEEVYTHLRNTNYEFINNFSEIEPYVTRELVRNCGKILVRAYFYAKWEGKVQGWKRYIEQFISYENISRSAGSEELKRYLLSEYNLHFVENEELENLTDASKVETLAKTLLDNGAKENEQLAHNSALLVYGIYALRKQNGESSNGNPYGYNTWWLTNQTQIQKHTVDLVRHNHAKYILRPEFVLNFMSLAPSCEQVRKTYSNIFPTNLGIQLGHRLNDDAYKSVMEKVKEWKSYEPGRINAKMAQLSDVLKADQLKVYDQTLESMNRLLSTL